MTAAQLRPCERLAYVEALSIAAELDGQGLDPSILTDRSRGECVVMLDGKIEAVVIGLTTEEPQLETVTLGEIARRDFVAKGFAGREDE